MIRLMAAAALVMAGASAQSQPATSHANPLVSVTWLAGHLRDPDLVLLHVGQESTYEAGHIPGARFVTLASLQAPNDPGTLTLEMLPPAQLRDALQDLGISDASHVVVYASDEFSSPSARVLLTLQYAGLSHASYLDGGLKGWTDAGQSLSKDVPAPKHGALSPLTPTPIVVDAAFVQAHEHAPGFAIVDARDRQFYDGTQAGGQRGQPQKFGHIPGALSAPFTTFASGDGHLKSADEIKAIFDAAGVHAGDTVVGYCHIGQQASAMLLAARVAGHPVLLYDGSFQDWSRRDLPVERASKKQ